MASRGSMEGSEHHLGGPPKQAPVIAGVLRIEDGRGARPVLDQIVDQVFILYSVEIGRLPHGQKYRALPLSTVMPALLASSEIDQGEFRARLAQRGLQCLVEGKHAFTGKEWEQECAFKPADALHPTPTAVEMAARRKAEQDARDEHRRLMAAANPHSRIVASKD